MKLEKKRIITSDGTSLQIYMIGHGEPLIFLHGNGESSGIFRRQVRYFVDHYRCILIDSRSHGKSERSKTKLTFARMAEDVREVMQAENISQADILGYSDGANIGMVLACKYPTLVKKLVLNSGNLTASGSTYLSRVLELIYIAIGKVLHWDMEVLSLLVKNTGLQMNDLQKITAKTLVLAGQFDFIKRSHTKEIAKNIPDSTLQIAKWTSHFFIRLQPRRFNRVICNFLGKEV
ncbi:Pimeloyl-ACP methyl ester carboxylesterase [Pilibacter termitis]|uniref:Pimeloyl-ACP methyl ester carboxylesterase n=1 Tax=Pilibacter termitis TaxID=263852 RepID=A0A1T4L3S0_9ENTE|nr:alpha/beta hydrolase [Pilibacter termitis]SJZ49369.1 Pimeloyl-ACP methyl ester carboxylesterase [Pilibacter termitis]